MIVWQSYDSEAPPISYLSGRRCNAQGQPDSEVWDLAFPRDPHPTLFSSTCAADGRFLVSWVGYDHISGPAYRELYVQRFDASGDSVDSAKIVSTAEAAIGLSRATRGLTRLNPA